MKIKQVPQEFKPIEITIETREELQLIRMALKGFEPDAILNCQTHHRDIRLKTIERVIRDLDEIELDDI